MFRKQLNKEKLYQLSKIKKGKLKKKILNIVKNWNNFF